MVLQRLRKRERTDQTDKAAADPPVADQPTRRWPRWRRGAPAAQEPAPREHVAPRRGLVWRRGTRGAHRRWAWRRFHPVSTALWAASWAAAIILVLGILLVASKANQANGIVHAIMRTGTWLATPFHDMFTNKNPDHQLYENWGLAAAVYFIVGRTLAWLIRI